MEEYMYGDMDGRAVGCFITLNEYEKNLDNFKIIALKEYQPDFELSKIKQFSYDGTISFYELICWFNEKYNCFIKEARELPPLYISFIDQDTGDLVNCNFLFQKVTIDVLGFNVIFHEDCSQQYNYDSYHTRKLYISDDDFSPFKGIHLIEFDNKYVFDKSVRQYETKILNKIDEDILKRYLEVIYKYKDFLMAYQTFKAYDPNPNNRFGGYYNTYIGTKNPFKSIEQFRLSMYGPYNESFFTMVYKLGNKYPEFCGNFVTGTCGFRISPSESPYDFLPKYTRIRRDKFNFDIDTSSVDFPFNNDLDKKLIYRPTK